MGIKAVWKIISIQLWRLISEITRMRRHKTVRQIQDPLVPAAIGSNLPADYLAGLTNWSDGQFLVRRPVDIGILANGKTSKYDAKKECCQSNPSHCRQFPEQAASHPSSYGKPDCRWLIAEAQQGKQNDPGQTSYNIDRVAEDAIDGMFQEPADQLANRNEQQSYHSEDAHNKERSR